MRKLLALILSLNILNSTANAITTREYEQLFKNSDSCFILYDLNKHKIISEYNPNNRCYERIAPDSTFKIPLSLMAFDQGIINQSTIFKWDGKKEDLPGWNQDQTPQSWLKYSVLWVSQQITPQLGNARIKRYLSDFAYGNQDFSGDPGKNNGLTRAWLSSSLKISAMEQLHLLSSMLSNQLPISVNSIVATKKNIYQGKLSNGVDYYGKTGSGFHDHTRDGWFIGFIENGNHQYIFVSNMTDKPLPTDKAYGSAILKPIVLKILNEYFEKVKT